MGKEIRIGDTERNESRALLDIHLAEGRLTIAEHEERVTRAGVAQTRGEVDKLFADLPLPRPKSELTLASDVAFTTWGLLVMVVVPVAAVVGVLAGNVWVIAIPVAVSTVAFIVAVIIA